MRQRRRETQSVLVAFQPLLGAVERRGREGPDLSGALAPHLGLDGSVGPSPAVYVIVGMVAVFGAIAHAPIAMLLMVAEMTQNLAVVPPAMLALAISALIVGETTIYRSQLMTRADQPALS